MLLCKNCQRRDRSTIPPPVPFAAPKTPFRAPARR